MSGLYLDEIKITCSYSSILKNDNKNDNKHAFKKAITDIININKNIRNQKLLMCHNQTNKNRKIQDR